MIGIGLGVFMATLDASIVNISLPTLVEELNTSFTAIEWVVLAYALVVTSLMLGAARLGDMYDKKKLYLGGLALFIIGSVLCGLAPSASWLIAFRALQGLGAVFTQALGIAIVTEIFPPAERGRALGIVGGVVSIGIAIGPPLGGLLIALTGWRFIFWVNLPVGLLALAFITRNLPSLARQDGQKQRFDLPGAMVLFATMSCYALGMTLGQTLGFTSPTALALLIAAAVGLAAFITLEARARQPMVDLSLFRNPLFSLNLAMGMLVFIVMTGAFIIPFFLNIVLHLDTQHTGLLMMASPIAMGFTAPLAGALSDRFGSRVISLSGLAIIVGGCLAISTLNTQSSPLTFALIYAINGLGMGLFQSPNNSAIMGSVPRERLGVASGLLSLSRTLGQTTGLPLIGALFTGMVIQAGALPAGSEVTSASPQALVAGLNGVYHIAAGFIAVAFVLALVAWRMDPPKRAAANDPIAAPEA